ncbi:hypothetical protein SCALM49S_06593 [Streptomyces californicus]
MVLTANVSAQSWVESTAAGPVRRMPATFTRTSTGPSWRSTRATVLSTELRSVTSITYGSRLPDERSPSGVFSWFRAHSAASASMPAGARSVAATRAPRVG